MIRVNAKIGKILSCKISDIDLFNASLSLVDLSEEICSNPECKAKGCCRAHASYTRDIISFYHGKRQESQVVIPRVYCESCGKTHALIPNHLIPYGSYSIRFILSMIIPKINTRFLSYACVTTYLSLLSTPGLSFLKSISMLGLLSWSKSLLKRQQQLLLKGFIHLKTSLPASSKDSIFHFFSNVKRHHHAYLHLADF